MPQMFGNGARYSVFDVMENKGVFRANPANAHARDVDGNSAYKGPVQYPKMMYHPTGETKITVPAAAEVGSLAGQYSGMYLNEQREMIHRIVNDDVERDEALDAGWHLHPSHAIEAGNRLRAERGEPLLPVPPISSGARVGQLEDELGRLRRELDEAKTSLARQTAADILGTTSQPVPADIVDSKPSVSKPSYGAVPPPLKGNAAKAGLV